jgi:hypothetical protein
VRFRDPSDYFGNLSAFYAVYLSLAKPSLPEVAPAFKMSDMHNQVDLKGYETVFTNVKAGMQGVDREKVKHIVYEMSKDSAHFREERRKQVRNNASYGTIMLSTMRANARMFGI